MPYKKKFSRKSPPKKFYKKKYKMNLGKLIDRKANTLIEKRMISIARKEARINNPALCLRRYCWVDYDKTTNKFDLLPAGNNSIDWNGKMVNLTEKIIKEDHAVAVNNPITDDPNTQFHETADRALDGANVVATLRTAHGRRTGDQIYLTAFSLDVRAVCDFTPFDGPDANLENFYDKIQVHLGLVKTRKLFDAGGNFLPPDPKELLPISPWGYHSALDPQINDLMNTRSKQYLWREKFTISSSNPLKPNIDFKRYNIGFKNPIKIDYSETDINAISNDFDVYLVCRTSVASTGEAEDAQSRPYIQCCAKLYYRNNK